MSTKSRFVVGGAAFILWGLILLPTRGATICTNETDFVAAVEACAVFLNEFTNFDYLGELSHPISASQNGISYTIFSQPLLHLVAFEGAVSTTQTNDQIQVALTSANVRAVGGVFFAADNNATPVSGSVSVSVSDGTMATITSQSNTTPAFLGFVSTGPLLSNLVLQASSAGAWPVLSHLYTAVGVPSIKLALTATNSLVLSWPAPCTSYVLQSNPDLAGTNWTEVGITPQQINDLIVVVIPTPAGEVFFRLRKQ